MLQTGDAGLVQILTSVMNELVSRRRAIEYVMLFLIFGAPLFAHCFFFTSGSSSQTAGDQELGEPSVGERHENSQVLGCEPGQQNPG